MERIPTRYEMAVFHAKAFLLQRMRGLRNLQQGIRRHPQRLDIATHEDGGWQELAVSRSALWTDPTPTEQWYQLGKVENLRRAAARIDGVVLEPDAVFSFWQQVGRATAARGYARGRMLLEGCLIPAVGGGLCQLSNALYQVALDAGGEILERHTHSRIVPGSATAAGRDATVAWNYIDLRFRHRQRVRLSVKLTTTELVVQLIADAAATPAQTAEPEPLRVAPIDSDHACDSCGKLACHLCEPALVELWSRRSHAFLLDGAWPEYFEWVSANHGNNDCLFIPLDGSSWNRPNYLWPLHGFARIHSARLQTLIRSWRSRRLAAQGAERQRALLRGAEQLARAYERKLKPEMDELVVAQNLLPFLWRMGALGGRRVRVLMQQMPIEALEATLDRAAAAHPESRTLKDFRAEPWLREAETRALDEAVEVITPHAAIARLFPGKARQLPWALPANFRTAHRGPNNGSTRILFPASTLGRKGAFELRAALTELRNEFEFKLVLGGRELEGVGFWGGLPVESTREPNLAEVDMVVLPTIVESQPRALLRALAAGVPVITTRESGLHEDCGAEFVEAIEMGKLKAAIHRHLQK